MVNGSEIVKTPVPVKYPHPFTLPLPVTVPEDTKETMSINPAGQTVPLPIMVAEPLPSPQPEISAVPVNLPLVARIVPQPTIVGAQPDTMPLDVTAGKPKGAR